MDRSDFTRRDVFRALAAAFIVAKSRDGAWGARGIKASQKENSMGPTKQGADSQFSGVFSVLPTPFTSEGAIDIVSLKHVVDLYINAGVNGLTALGVTAEVSRLDDRERDLVLETVIAHVGARVPVVAGATAEGTMTCVELCRQAKARKASAVMVSPPRMGKLNSDAVVAHYHAVASAVDMPIVVQDYPPASGYTVEPFLLLRIAREIPHAQTIKLEDPPTPLKTARILAEAGDLKLSILGGLGGAYLLEELMAGASGVMTGFAYPEMLVEVVKLFRGGHTLKAADAFYRYTPLLRFEAQEGIGLAIRKEVLRRRGALLYPGVRPPGPNLGASTRDALDQVVGWMRKQGVEWT